jgi:hypothetical protein
MAPERHRTLAVSRAHERVVDTAGVADVPGPRDQPCRGDCEVAYLDAEVRCPHQELRSRGEGQARQVRDRHCPREQCQRYEHPQKRQPKPTRRSPSDRTRAHNAAIRHAVAGRAR